MKRFLIFVAASMFCVTTFAETAQQVFDVFDLASKELAYELSYEMLAEFASPSESIGEGWVSDFKQKSFYVHSDYLKAKDYIVYRKEKGRFYNNLYKQLPFAFK